MRLLIITNDFPPAAGGIENYTYSLARRWTPSDVVVLSRWMPGCEKFDKSADFEVQREPTGTLLPTPALFRRARAIVRTNRVDVIHFPSSLPLGLIGKKLDRPYALSVHGGEWVLASRAPGARQALRRVAVNAAVVLPESSFAEGLVRRFLGSKACVERVTCGVDPERYTESAPCFAEPDRPVIVTISRLIARKGQSTLIKALPALLRDHPGARVVIVGGGPYLTALRRLACRLDVEPAVAFAGSEPWESVPRHLAASDVFALPTRARFAGTETEGLPLALMEAAASGLPLVAGNVGGIPDVVRPGETGILVDGSSPADTGRAIKSLFDDPHAAREMGSRARKMVLEQFTWDRAAERYRAALETWCSKDAALPRI